MLIDLPRVVFMARVMTADCRWGCTRSGPQEVRPLAVPDVAVQVVAITDDVTTVVNADAAAEWIHAGRPIVDGNDAAARVEERDPR